MLLGCSRVCVWIVSLRACIVGWILCAWCLDGVCTNLCLIGCVWVVILVTCLYFIWLCLGFISGGYFLVWFGCGVMLFAGFSCTAD